MQVARVNLVDWHHIGQQPFARLARTRQVDDAVIARCQGWIAEHYDEPSPVSAMVAVSGLDERTFKRRCRHATGMSPLEYVHALRFEEAKQMLEASDEPIEAIANEIGYEGRGLLQPSVSAQDEPEPRAVSAALRRAAPDVVDALIGAVDAFDRPATSSPASSGRSSTTARRSGGRLLAVERHDSDCLCSRVSYVMQP